MMEDAMLDQARINRHLHCVIFLDPYLFDSEQTLVFSREFAPHLLVYFYNFMQIQALNYLQSNISRICKDVGAF